jgi:putative phosphotransacetylase
MNTEQIVQVIAQMVKEKLKEDKKLMVPVGVSARHIHLTREHLDILFGKGYELKKFKELMGGQFAAEECVTIVGGKMTSIEKVRILGPLRNITQVEISKTDAVKLGTKAPLRESGNIKGSAPITIIGPKGAVALEEGCIVAKRHIHMSSEDADKYGLKDNDKVDVKISGERGGLFQDVKVRVDKSYTLEMHIDTDEANGMDIPCGSKLEVIIKG